ncbi:MAG: Ig-like domain-containing protein [Gemmatimonadota bacterium]
MSRIALRWGAVVIAAVAIGSACAHVEPPPGGPDDTTPPAVLTVRPDAGAVVPGHEGPVVFVFDERISERSIEDAVSVSPRTSAVEVRHGRDEIRVSLRRGWEPGTIYHVGIASDVQDLFNNRLAAPIRLVFSTGPEIPETEISGGVIDRISGAVQRDVRVEAIRTDSLVYATAADSSGAFVIEQFPEGEYVVRAFRDLNGNRALDDFEARDSALVTVSAGDSPDVRLRIVEADSTPPEPHTAEAREGRIRIEFDDYLDPEQEMQAVTVSVTGGGESLPVGAVSIGEPPPAPADTVQSPAGPEPLPSTRPSQTVFVELGEAADLVPGTEYEVVIGGIANIVGIRGGGVVTFSVPEEPTAP